MMEPSQIKQLREANGVSQPVFARYLNTSESTVEKWETGAKRPSGIALKLLTIVAAYGLQILTAWATAIAAKDDDSEGRRKHAV
jgi:putative transcriptional regulator